MSEKARRISPARSGWCSTVTPASAMRSPRRIIKELIDGEDKIKPYSDEKIEEILNQKGYNIARRTVAKYREQLNIPVARLRKEM